MLEFVCAVPAFTTALRHSTHLSRHPGQRCCWLVLLCAAAANPTAGPRKASTGLSAAALADLQKEAVENVRALLRAECETETLTHVVDLVSRLLGACAVVRALLTSQAGKPLVDELEQFHSRARASLGAGKTGGTGEEGSAAGAAGANEASDCAADGPDKRAELLQRAALTVKKVLQGIRAPGKGD